MDERVQNMISKANNGDVSAMVIVGNCYLRGEGVRKDDSLAHKYYMMAAERGNIPAKYMVEMFSIDKKAFTYFEKAAKQGLGKAQIELGDAYIGGIGVRANLGEGLFWLVCAYLHGRNDADVGNAAVERLNSLINSGVPGGRERIDGIMDEIKLRYPQYIKEPN